MADEEELEKDEKKKGGLLLYALIGVSAMLLLVVGLGVGYFIFSAPTNTPEEVEKVISEVQAENKKKGEGGAEGAEEDCVENEEGKKECGPKKISKPSVKEKVYKTLYFQMPGSMTTNLKGSTKFLQVEIGISTRYDEEVVKNVEAHQTSLKAGVLGVLSDFTEEDVAGREGREAVSNAIKEMINAKLKELEGFGGVEGVHLTGFVMQ
ncbi:MAG: flagellar basal body-associated FliL family protein [Rhodospirillaceae bacterium]